MLRPVTIEAVVADLRKVDRRAGWRRVNLIGEIIVKRVYGGDREACRQPKRRALSIRRIAEHPECPFRKSRLAEAIGVYLLQEDLPWIRECEHIGPSHVAAVLPVEFAHQVTLLQRAEGQKWSVRQLRQEVVELRRNAGERRGRPRLDAHEKSRQQIAIAVAALERARAELQGDRHGKPLLKRVEEAIQLLVSGGTSMVAPSDPRRPAGANTDDVRPSCA